jgi:hypothetical protein
MLGQRLRHNARLQHQGIDELEVAPVADGARIFRRQLIQPFGLDATL